MTKHYRNFDIEDLMDSEHYATHVSAMTDEKLHSKSNIAAELAYRDKRIAELEQENNQILGWVARAMMKGCCHEDVTKEALQETLDQHYIEQQIKALDRLEDGLTWSSDMGCLVVTSEYIAERMEQLRKGVSDGS